MAFSISYTCNEAFQKLGWLAVVNKAEKQINVVHGPSVECHTDWMVEGVWDDDFKKGAFHISENFFGSGIRVEDNNIYFVASSSRADRIFYCEDNEQYVFSNSLILILSYTGAQLDDNYDYIEESTSICRGLNEYKKEYRILHHEIKCFYQIFYENIKLNEKGISFQNRYKRINIDSYNQYYDIIMEVLQKLRANYESNARKYILSAYSTLSQGYDSTAVSCLVKNIGVKNVFIANRIPHALHLPTLMKEKAGALKIAKLLGYKTLCINSSRKSISEDELYFLATNYPKYNTRSWSEVSLHGMAKYIESHNLSAVVFTGHHGDSVWDINLSDEFLNDERKTPSMMGFCQEMRIKAGFINIPVPIIEATNIKDIISISRSREMIPWRLDNDYDRPIPRRISEEAGVPRSMFGQKKRFIANLYLWPINPVLRRKFFKFLKKTKNISLIVLYIEYIIQFFCKFPFINILQVRMRSKSNERYYFLIKKNIDIYYSMVHWAICELTVRFSKIIK